MNCTQAQDRFADLLDRRLAEADTAEVRTHLAGCPDCQREYASLAATLSVLDKLPAPKPSPRFRANFYAMIEEEKNSATSIRAAAARQRRAARWSLWRWIVVPTGTLAVALLAFQIGMRLAPQPPPAQDNHALLVQLARLQQQNTEQQKQLAGIQDQMNKMGGDLFKTSELQRTTSERLNNVLATLDQKNPDQKVIAGLIGALVFDPSVNVRLSALEALSPHADQQLVREGVLASFPRESNSLVKVAMIDFFVTAHEHSAAPELEKLARDQSVDAAVRDAAKRGLAML